MRAREETLTPTILGNGLASLEETLGLTYVKRSRASSDVSERKVDGSETTSYRGVRLLPFAEQFW